MSLEKIAILLEISGFIIASVFAGIFLERGALGHFSNRLYAFLASFSKSLEHTFPLPVLPQIKSAVLYAIFSVFALQVPLALVFIGWLRSIPFVLIAGVAMLLGFLTPALQAIRRSEQRVITTKEVAEDLLLLLLVIPLLLFTAVVTLLRLVAEWLVEKDILKIAFIAFGSALLLSGLILELIATP